MTICFYSPYLPDHFGGGEKHLFDVATTASQHHQVVLAVSASKVSGDSTLQRINDAYTQFFNSELSQIKFVSTPLGTSASFFQKILWTQQFDALYYVTDGSLFFSLAKHNYLHIQVPFTVSKDSVLDRLKLMNWQHKNTNSFFTKQVVETAWKTPITEVVHPLVDLTELQASTTKKKVILNVGRFFKHLHSKRQDILIQCFKQLCQQHPRLLQDWQLVLAGSIEDKEYLTELKKLSSSANVTFAHDLKRSELVKLYQQASVYWHATGYGTDERTYPEKQEHFGISTVEAMAAGAVPLVYYAGGQKEVLGETLSYLGWHSVDECVTKTAEIIANSQQANRARNRAISQAATFSKPLFEKKVLEMFTS